MDKWTEDTIVAISTPPGRGAIGLVRMSGDKASEIAERLFRAADGKKVSSFRTHRMQFGRIMSDEKVIDEAMLCVMRKPKSYTGEDIVEMSCHGSPLVLRAVVEECVRLGATLALPGEFTKRAFLNGKIDLTQAEAVAEVIEARNDRALRGALKQLKGELKEKVKELRGRLLDIAAGLEAAVDFPEEELNFASRDENLRLIMECSEECGNLLNSYKDGRIIRDGLRVAIIGKVNVGKSSLFNRIVGSERAIVTDEKGTTRDVVEEDVSIGGMRIIMADTAGIGISGSAAVTEGVRRSHEALNRADLILFVMDSSQAWSERDSEISRAVAGKKGILIFNKEDLEKRIDKESTIVQFSSWPFIEISALTGSGIDSLKEMLLEACGIDNGREDLESTIIVNVRQGNALKKCARSLERTLEAAINGYSEEIIGMEVREAAGWLGEITGESAGEDLLDRIFSRFCIGK